MKRWNAAITMALIALTSTVASDTTAAVQYTLTNLGNIPNAWPHVNATPAAISNVGQVVGSAIPNGGSFNAFFYSGGAMQNLNTLLNSTYSIATAINESGTVAGNFRAADGSENVFLYKDGGISDLGKLPGGVWAEAADINNNGQIVGTCCASDHYEHAFLFSNGSMQDLGLFGGIDSEANGINDNGQITGYIATGSKNIGYVYDQGALTTFTLTGYQSTSGDYINSHGQVAGSAMHDLGSVPTHAFFYSGGRIQDIGTLNGNYSVARGINEDGVVVGYSTYTSNPTWGEWHAYIYQHGMMQDLNSLIAPFGGALQTATGINDIGQIVGVAQLPSGDSFAYLLTPIPEPSTVALLGIGAIGLLAYAWRCRRAT